jgi:hypothetical protein
LQILNTEIFERLSENKTVVDYTHYLARGCYFSKVDNPAIKTVAGSGPKNTRPHRFLKPVRSVSGEVVCINTDLENRNRP